jgi:hypothetical protein
MTEKEWLSGKEPRRMLDFVAHKSSERKLRLFVCGYLRTFLARYEHTKPGLVLECLETSERFADGLAAVEEVEACRKKARAAVKEGNGAARLAVGAAFLNLNRAVASVFGDLTTSADRTNKLKLLHDLWGPLPFRNLPVDASWLAPKVLELAKSIYNERTFDQLPVLADALEEVGCHDADILRHCSGEGPHFKGCWVLDLIVGNA